MKKTSKIAVCVALVCLLAAGIYLLLGKKSQHTTHDSTSQSTAETASENASHDDEHSHHLNHNHTDMHHQHEPQELSQAQQDVMNRLPPVNTPDTVAPDTVNSTIGRFGVAAPDISHEAINTEQNAEQLMLAVCASRPDVMASVIDEYKNDYATLLSGFGVSRECQDDACQYRVDDGALLAAFKDSGLQQGDYITHINNLNVTSTQTADAFLQSFNFKSANVMTVARDGAEKIVELNCSNAQFSQLPDYTDEAKQAEAAVHNKLNKLGLAD